MYHPRTDITHKYVYKPTDFIKHLASTTIVVLVITSLFSAVFHEPIRPILTIKKVATATPVMFQKVALRALNGQGHIANYGPPYNHGTGYVEDPIQTFVGVIHPINVPKTFVIQPLQRAAYLNPQINTALRQFDAASPFRQKQWENAYATALNSARVVQGRVVVPTGNYGPIAPMMMNLLSLGKSGMMAGTLDRSPADYSFDNMNSLLFLQGAPLHAEAKRLQLLGTQYGIIHEERTPYPGPWWMTIVTVIYQIPFIAKSPAADALALISGLLLFLILVFAPWIPIINRLPRYLGIHRLIWRHYYHTHQKP